MSREPLYWPDLTRYWQAIERDIADAKALPERRTWIPVLMWICCAFGAVVLVLSCGGAI